MAPSVGESPPVDQGPLLTVPSSTNSIDLTPSSSPTIARRPRNSSMSNPLPSIHLELESLSMKVDPVTYTIHTCTHTHTHAHTQVNDLLTTLESELLAAALAEVADTVNKKNPTSESLTSDLAHGHTPASPSALLQEFRNTLSRCLKQVLAVNPGPNLTMTMQALVETAKTYTQGLTSLSHTHTHTNLLLSHTQSSCYSSLSPWLPATVSPPISPVLLSSLLIRPSSSPDKR